MRNGSMFRVFSSDLCLYIIVNARHNIKAKLVKIMKIMLIGRLTAEYSCRNYSLLGVAVKISVGASETSQQADR